MASAIREFKGLKAFGIATPVYRSGISVNPECPSRAGRTRLTVQYFKKAAKKKQIVLLENVEHLGQEGELVTVAMGYWRNYLEPFRKAKAATPEILAAIQSKKDEEERARAEIKNKAMRVAVALKTIGKFVIKKKSGDGSAIFGSVTSQNVVDAIYQQTGQTIDKDKLQLPEIRTLGAYDVSVRLHPEVVGTFKVIVAQEKNAPGRK